MSIFDEYLDTIEGNERKVLSHMYTVARSTVPEAEEVISYNMPAFALKGKAFLSIMANKKFMSLYPFCNLDRLDMNFSHYECTKGSIHFTPDQPISDEMLQQIIRVRLQQL